MKDDDLKLSKEDKIAIVRQYMIEHPKHWEYGYGAGLIKYFKQKHNVVIQAPYISKLIDEVKEQWRDAEARVYEKSQIIQMHMDIHSRFKSDGNIQVKTLIEIGKLQGDYVEKHELSGGLKIEGLYPSLSDEDRGRLDVALSALVEQDKKKSKK